MASNASRKRPCILIAEDYGVIAVMLYEDLTEAGFEVSGPFTSAGAALTSLERQNPDAAILDVELSDGPCVALARALREKRIPFVVLTGHTSDVSHDDAFSGAPWLSKPLSHDALINTVRTLLRPTRSVAGLPARRQANLRIALEEASEPNLRLTKQPL
jgi:DNA-binding response OmpR family regulator